MAKKTSKAKSKKTVKEKKYKSFEAMRKGHKILTFAEIHALNEPSLTPFIEEEEWGKDGEIEGAYLFACMDSGRAIESILKKHKLHVITMSIFESEEEEMDENDPNYEPSIDTYSYSTGFHWVNRERYFLCRVETPAFFEDKG